MSARRHIREPAGEAFATYLRQRGLLEASETPLDAHDQGPDDIMQILITGGAGFIGSHLADELLRCGHPVRALADLWPQVNGTRARRPAYLDDDVELLRGDVRDAATVRRALAGVDAVYHFASAVGVGQSMYEIEHYVSVNNTGTAVLLQALSERPIARLIVA